MVSKKHLMVHLTCDIPPYQSKDTIMLGVTGLINVAQVLGNKRKGSQGGFEDFMSEQDPFSVVVGPHPRSAWSSSRR
jgi:hypothetical protein